MQYAEILLNIAEIGIALAGFGGIAAGLGYRAHGEWSEQDQIRLIAMALTSLAVVFSCYIPFVIHHLGATSPWRIAAGCFFFVAAIGLFEQVRLNRDGIASEYSRIAAAVIFLSQSTSLILLSCIALGYGGTREFGLYLSTVCLALTQASILFVRLLFTSFGER